MTGDATVHDMPWEVLELLAARFGLLANPARLAILQQLCHDELPELSVGSIVRATGLKQPHVSKQLGMLDAAGMVRRRADGNHVLYSLADASLPDLCGIVHASLAARQEEIATKLRSVRPRRKPSAASPRPSLPPAQGPA